MAPAGLLSRVRAAAASPLLRDPGVVAAILLALLLTGFALAVDFPKASFGFQSDEATYYTLGHSLAEDGDFAFDRGDLARVYREFATGPEGIFLKKGRARWLEGQHEFPWIRLASAPDPQADRLYFAKSFAYPLAAAPLVFLFGTAGFLVLHAVLLALSLLAAYWFLRGCGSEPRSALAYASVFFLASAAPVYFVWITPEIFNLSLGVLGLFCGLYRLVSPDPPLDAGRWSRFLRGAGGPCLGAAIIGVAAFSKPTNAALAVPIVAGVLLRRDWRVAMASSAAFGLTAAAFVTLNLVTSGEASYQGGDRATYYEAKGFPFMTAAAPTVSPLTATQPAPGGGAVGLARSVDSVLYDIILTRDSLLEVFPANLRYFVLGRHSGLVPYFFPGVLSVLLFLFAGRGRRTAFQWITLGTAVFANLVLLLWVPYTYSGGGGPIGNRYFMGLYPLLLFVTPALRSALPAVCGLAIGALFTAPLVMNPFYTSYRPAEHPKHGPLRWLPLEKSLLNDLPINVTPERVRIQLAGEPRISAYFFDDNAFPPEGEWFWVKGGARADLLLRAPVREVSEGGQYVVYQGVPRRYLPYRLRQLKVEVRTGDVANVVTIATGADRQRLELGAHRDTVATVRAEAGLPYRAHLDQPTSYVYAVSITSATGFTPTFTQGAGNPDQRYLGVLVRLVPMYD
jgi:hypothetical protein